MTKESERNVTDFVSEIRRIKRRAEDICKFMYDVQSDTYNKGWKDYNVYTDEECLYDSREKVCEMLVAFIEDAEFIASNLIPSLEEVER